MKIIDSKKDYYDYVSGIYGIDDKVVFDRRGSKVLEKRILKSINESPAKDDFDFVGEFYVKIGDWVYRFDRDEESWSWSMPDKMIFGNLFGRTVLSNPVKYESFPYKEKLPDDVISVFCKHFKIRTNANKKFYGYLSYQRSSEISNPLLNNFEFIKKYISPEDAWQKIYDFISSRNEKPIIDNRSDAEHLESAGFDKKTSFRNIK